MMEEIKQVTPCNNCGGDGVVYEKHGKEIKVKVLKQCKKCKGTGQK